MGQWRNRTVWMASYHAIVCGAIIALSLARVAPPSFFSIPSNSPTVNCDRHHEPKLRFDQGELYWCRPVAVLTHVAPVVFSPLMRELSPVISSYTNGAHYTRPPPLA
jgi:hypothetical protein